MQYVILYWTLYARKKMLLKDVLVRVLQKNRTNRMYINIEGDLA